MAAGSLDRRITIQRATTVPNEFNEPVETWADYAALSCSRRDVSDGEKFAAGQVGSFLQTRFKIRWSEVAHDIRPTDRILHEGDLWNIIGGPKETPEGRRRYLEITASKDTD